MRQPNEKAHRWHGGQRDAVAGVRLAHDTPNTEGWICIEGDSNVFATSRHDRSMQLLVRVDAIADTPRAIRSKFGPRSVVHVVHRGTMVAVRANECADDLRFIIEARRNGGAA